MSSISSGVGRRSWRRPAGIAGRLRLPARAEQPGPGTTIGSDAEYRDELALLRVAAPFRSRRPGSVQLAAARTRTTAPVPQLRVGTASSEPEAATGLLRWIALDSWTIVLIVAFGTLIVAGAYALGRHQLPHAAIAYWVGELLILGPTALTTLSRRAGVRARVYALVATAAAQSMLAWCYSPAQLTEGDEWLHLATLHSILNSHHLFSPNVLLPVSSGFPGLEIATSAVVRLTGLSDVHAAVIVVSCCHILLPVAVFLLFLNLTEDSRMAGACAFVYTLAPHYAYYNTLFVYGVPALLFLTVMLASASGSWRRRTTPVWAVIVFLPLGVTHHVTAFAALVLLALMVWLMLLRRAWRLAIYFGVICVLLADDFITWIEVHAPSTFSYIWGTVGGSFLSQGSQETTTKVITGASAPKWEHYAGELSGVLLLGLVCLGVIITWRRTRALFPRILSLLGLVYGVVLVVRVVSSDGAELSARALDFAMFLVAYPVVMVLTTLWPRSHTSRFRALFRFAVVGGVLILLLVGEVVTGLPAAWQRIPGTFEVATDELGVDARVIDVATWGASVFKPGQLVSCDVAVCGMWGADAGANPTAAAMQYYFVRSPAALNAGLHSLSVSYVETDSRWTTDLPDGGSYFDGPTPTLKWGQTFPSTLMTKFTQDPELDRLYDDGDIRVYYAGRA